MRVIAKSVFLSKDLVLDSSKDATVRIQSGILAG